MSLTNKDRKWLSGALAGLSSRRRSEPRADGEQLELPRPGRKRTAPIDPSVVLNSHVLPLDADDYLGHIGITQWDLLEFYNTEREVGVVDLPSAGWQP